MNEIIARLEAMNAQVSIYRSNYKWSETNRWVVRMTLEDDGLQAQAESTGDTMAGTLKTCWDKFHSLTRSGFPQALLAPPVESEVVHFPGTTLDKDQPF